MPDYKLLETINCREGLLEEFNEEIFNALVEKIEILTPAHFAFELKNRMRVEEVGRSNCKKLRGGFQIDKSVG